MIKEPIVDLLEGAITAREALFDAQHQTAFRLFNGFTEGWPSLVIDIYAGTIVLHNYADPPEDGASAVYVAQNFLQDCFPWVHTMVLKTRHGLTVPEKHGTVVYGSTTDRLVLEHKVKYAIDLQMNQDTSLYLDTRNLRRWALRHLKDKSVLNAFAYTGSFGVAAMAGSATQVVHIDRNHRFLNIAKISYSLNNLPINKSDFRSGDFWLNISRLKRAGDRFDCVFIDPPFFAATKKGTVNLMDNNVRLINKVRPLINDGGYLVAINNALFLSGKAYMETLESLCADGYLQIEELIPVPSDFTGYPQTQVSQLPVDPAPFNHATKIAIMKVRRKAEFGS